MPGGNSTHRGMKIGASDEFAAHEALPARLRQAIAEAPFKMTSVFALQLISQGYSEDELITMLHARQQELAGDGKMPKQTVRPIKRLRNARRGRLWR